MSRFRRFLQLINPLAALGDLGRELQRPHPHRWPLMGVAAAATFAVFSVMFQEGAAGLPRPPEITYVDSFAPDRSDAEIVAGNIAATKAGRARDAEEAASRERVRQMYKTLGRVSGMDVDAIEAKAQAERKADAAKAQATAIPKARVARVNE